MNYRPQRIIAPDGTEMVVIRASDYDRLVAAAQLHGDANVSDRSFAGGVTSYPAIVTDAVLSGATPLRAWRESQGITQVELARRAGVTATALNRIETGKNYGRPATRRAIARALGTHVSALDHEHARDADRIIASDDARYPAAVADAILDGATPTRAWRAHRGITQVELARRAGITSTALNKIESGKRDGRPATRRAIARALAIPVSALDPMDD